MATTHARSRAVTTSPQRGGAHGGGETEPLPRDAQLPLGVRIADLYSEEARVMREHVRKALLSTGKSLNDVAEELRMDGSLLTRMLSGNGANLDPRVIAYALWRDPTHDLARYFAGLASGKWEPLPPPDGSYWFALVKEDLERRGLWGVVSETVGYQPPPPEVKP